MTQAGANSPRQRRTLYGRHKTYISRKGMEVRAVFLVGELVINFLFIDQRFRLSRNRSNKNTSHRKANLIACSAYVTTYR